MPPESKPVMIGTSGIDAGYAGSHVLFGVDFGAAERDITVIVGPNGSGKSTLLKSMFGLCTVYSGRVTYGGADITKLAPHEIARRRVAYLPQVDNVFVGLTVHENLVMAGYTMDSGTARRRIPDVLDTFPALREYRGSKADSLSGGQRQMLAMAMALVRDPKVMLFDEPTASLSPKLAADVLRKIVQVRDEYGITVILVEQNVRRALEMCDYAYLLAGGIKQFDGRPDELLRHPDLGRLYLGTGAGTTPSPAAPPPPGDGDDDNAG